MNPRRPIARHVEFERLFGADFLPISKHQPKQHSDEAQTRSPKRKLSEVEPPEFIQFRKEVLSCKKCDLCKTRTQVVFGVGNLKAPLVFIGEAPGADEDEKGEPFVGRAGQLLTQTLSKVGVTRDQIYIANILKCRPPDNRTPRPDEMAACLPHLLKQLDWIQPGRICAMGNIAVQALLQTTQGISRLRGQYHDFKGRKLFATFHPAYVLRNMSQAPVFEGDLRQVCKDAGLVA